MIKKQCIISKCVQLGEMPLYLIYYTDRKGIESQCVMLCTFSKLKKLMRLRRGFSNPEQYGHILFKGHPKQADNILEDIIKSRYAFDLENERNHEIRLF